MGAQLGSGVAALCSFYKPFWQYRLQAEVQRLGWAHREEEVRGRKGGTAANCSRRAVLPLLEGSEWTCGLFKKPVGFLKLMVNPALLCLMCCLLNWSTKYYLWMDGKQQSCLFGCVYIKVVAFLYLYLVVILMQRNTFRGGVEKVLPLGFFVVSIIWDPSQRK